MTPHITRVINLNVSHAYCQALPSSNLFPDRLGTYDAFKLPNLDANIKQKVS